MALLRPQLVPPPVEGVVRIGRQSDPFRFKSAAALAGLAVTVGAEGGNRFDAPADEYQTIYLATTEYDGLIEVLARFRQDPSFVDRVDAFLEGEEADPEYERELKVGQIPRDFFDTRGAGWAVMPESVRFIDVEHPDTHAAVMAVGGSALLRRLGLARIDRGAFLQGDRAVTRALAGVLHEHYASPSVVGLRYSSSLDSSAECWALWDSSPALLGDRDVAPLSMTSTAVLKAAATLRLEAAPPS